MERHSNHYRKFAIGHAAAMLSIVVGLTTVASQARAVQTTDITINGTIEAGTCEVSAGDVNKLVTLDTIKVSDVTATGIVAPKTFALTADCDAGLSNAIFTFTGTKEDLDPPRFKNVESATDAAKGVGVELEQVGDSTPIGADGTSNSRTVVITGGKGVIQLRAGYWHTPGVAVGSGRVKAVVTVTMGYN